MTVVETRMWMPPSLNSRITRSLSAALMPAVEQPDAQIREDLAAAGARPSRWPRAGRSPPTPPRGAHDVDLPARRDLLAQELVDLAALDPAARDRDDRLAAGRQLVEHRDVEIAVEREGERARDGRGRHHEHVRALALAPQRRALGDPEAVLLVHHGQAEAPEARRHPGRGRGCRRRSRRRPPPSRRSARSAPCPSPRW